MVRFARTLGGMAAHLDLKKAFPAGYRAMLDLEQACRDSALPTSTFELVKLRASMVNAWNRIAITGHAVPGRYRPDRPAVA